MLPLRLCRSSAVAQGSDPNFPTLSEPGFPGAGQTVSQARVSRGGGFHQFSAPGTPLPLLAWESVGPPSRQGQKRWRGL